MIIKDTATQGWEKWGLKNNLKVAGSCPILDAKITYQIVKDTRTID